MSFGTSPLGTLPLGAGEEAAGGGISQPLGLNTGAAEVPQAFSKSKQKIIGQIAGSAETLFSITPALAWGVIAQPLGLITGAAETLFPITSAKQKAIGLAVGEAEQVNALIAKKTKAIGLLSDAPGELPGVTLAGNRAVRLIVDSSEVFSLTSAKRKAFAQITGATEVLGAFTRVKGDVLGQVVDATGEVQPMGLIFPITRTLALIPGEEQLFPFTVIGGADVTWTPEASLPASWTLAGAAAGTWTNSPTNTNTWTQEPAL